LTRQKQYVTFYCDHELFGIDIRCVNEVTPYVNVLPVPLSGSHIKGLVNIRGQVVMVIDIAVVFGKENSSPREGSHVVILKTTQDFVRVRDIRGEFETEAFGDKPVGFFVDKLGDTVIVGEDQVENPTRYIEKAYSQYINGLVKLQGDLLILIDPVKILMF
jgi:purine-binding chemotaxis protein CheW